MLLSRGQRRIAGKENNGQRRLDAHGKQRLRNGASTGNHLGVCSSAVRLSPLRKALIDSGLGEDLTPVSGMESELKQIMFCAGLRNTGSADVKKSRN